jgi:hypothetical protein
MAEMVGNSRKIFELGLIARNLKALRIVDNVHEEHTWADLGPLALTSILPGIKWHEFVDPPLFPTSVKEEIWTLYLMEFVMDSYEPLQAMLAAVTVGATKRRRCPKNTWLRYNGCSLYAASAMLATNHPCPSDAEVAGTETACGRGVYTSRDFRKAVSYSTHHRLPGSGLLT